MLRKTDILTAVGTLGCAAVIGFLMQHSTTAEMRYGTGAVAAGPGTERAELGGLVAGGNALLDVQSITLTSAEFDASINVPDTGRDATPMLAQGGPLIPPEMPEVAIAPDCEIAAHARAVAGAMVNVTLDAQCLPNERITVHHNGMIFTQTTSASGTLDLMVPALATDAVFILAFSNGDGAVAQVHVDELADFDRVVLQWKGQSGFQIHAREFGADYGEEGHVWEGAPRDVTDAIAGKGGFMTLNGDPAAADALMAEVYSFPVAANHRSGDIDLTVEAEINHANCGLEIEAQTLETERGRQVKTQNLSLSVPDCDAVGTFLVLNNLLQDLKVAAR